MTSSRTIRSLSLILFLLTAALVGGSLSVSGQQTVPEGDRILGVWRTADGKAHIAIYRAGEKYSGRIIWLKEPEKDGMPVLDDKNPDPNLRGRSILNLEMMYGFVYDGDGVWVDGRVYDPEGGDEYRGKLRLVDANTMDLRGYVMIPLFGRTETWTRVK